MVSNESLLKKYSVHPKKSMGQNFLISPHIIEKIISALELTTSDDVLEIGAGLGVMAAMIAERCHTVYAVEKDKTLAAIIKKELGGRKNLQVINGDFLKLEIACPEQGRGASLPLAMTPIKLIGNIPYNITTPIILKLIRERSFFSRAVVMVQKEFADRMMHKPGSKEYGVLSIMAQAFANCEKLFTVKPSCFIPQPAVDSVVMMMKFKSDEETGISDVNTFEKLVATVFSKRRKTLRNALSAWACPEKIEDLLYSCGINSSRRPETLSVKEYIALSNKNATCHNIRKVGKCLPCKTH